jgi:hypothetical protein
MDDLRKQQLTELSEAVKLLLTTVEKLPSIDDFVRMNLAERRETLEEIERQIVDAKGTAGND